MILFKDATVVTMDEKRKEQYEKLDIVTKDDIIYYVGKNYNGKYDKVIDCTNKIIIPGLVNAHTHLGMSIFRNTSDNMSLLDWLENKTWVIESKMTDDDYYLASLLSCCEAILTGTTTVADHYVGNNTTINAIKESGIRCLFTNFLRDNDNLGNKRLNDFKSLYKEHKNDSDLISFALAPHSLYTCSKNYLKKISYFASKYNLPVHMHYCETVSEVDIINKNYKNIIDALISTDLINNKLILAHGIYINKKELDKLKNYDISIVHNPISNLVLGSGICDIKKIIDKKINVCLGTDGAGSSFNLNMFYHMSIVDLLQKGIYKNANIMNSYDVLKMATINGAKALGLAQKIGSIEENKKADLVMLDLSDITIYPENNLISQIVHNVNRNMVVMTMINGKILNKNGKLTNNLNINKLKYEINKIIERVK